MKFWKYVSQQGQFWFSLERFESRIMQMSKMVEFACLRSLANVLFWGWSTPWFNRLVPHRDVGRAGFWWTAWSVCLRYHRTSRARHGCLWSLALVDVHRNDTIKMLRCQPGMFMVSRFTDTLDPAFTTSSRFTGVIPKYGANWTESGIGKWLLEGLEAVFDPFINILPVGMQISWRTRILIDLFTRLIILWLRILSDHVPIISKSIYSFRAKEAIE